MAQVEIDVVARDSFSSVLGNIGNIFSGIESAINLIGQAFNAAVNTITPFVASASEAELAVSNLNATLASMGDVTGLSSEQLQELANGFQEITRFSDESILNAEAMLLTFGNIGGEVFPQAIELTLDLAEKFGSLDQASVMLGKALNDPIAGVTALRRVGVQLSESQEEQIRLFMEAGEIMSAQQVIMAELERQVGGLAEAYGDTFAGKVEIFKNRLDEIRETIGNGLLPLLSTLVDKFEPFLPVLEALGENIASVFATLNFALQEDNWMFFFGALERLDIFVGSIFQKIADGINEWVSGGGPQELSDEIVSWIGNIGTGAEFESRTLQAVSNIFTAIGNAIGEVDWSGIAVAIDERLSEVVENHDWSGSGDAFGEALAEAFRNFDGASIGTDSSFISSLGQGISDWFLAAAGVADWGEFKTTFLAIIQQFVFDPVKQWIKDNWITIILPAIPTDAAREKMRPLAQEMIRGLIDGLNSIDVAAQQWVDDHIINPIKRALGIASPSTVFISIGRDIVLGLMAGFASAAGTFLSFVNNIVDTILSVFDPVLELIGVSTGGGTGGATGDATGLLGDGGTTGGGSGPGTPAPGGGGGSGAGVTNNYYGPVYFQGAGEPGAYYDCPSPNPFMTATAPGISSGGVR